MRLWHQDLIKVLPRQQLLGQHRECAALRGKGWLKPHSVINYIFKYDLATLFAYHQLIMEEMTRRGYKVDDNWQNIAYRGKICPPICNILPIKVNGLVYPEHNDSYLRECIENLRSKNIELGGLV